MKQRDIVARLNTAILKGKCPRLLQVAVREIVNERMKVVRLEMQLDAVRRAAEVQSEH